MSIKMQCPQGHRLVIKDELAGKTGRCPHCHAVVKIPAPKVPSCGKLSEQAILEMLGTPIPASQACTESAARPAAAQASANFRLMPRTKKTCPKCKTSVSSGMDLCTRCNTYFANNSEVARRFAQ